MRNWNHTKSHLCTSLIKLYLTYEELKLIGLIFCYIVRLLLLYLTYEELKHAFTIVIFSFVNIFGCTLPMRNWNTLSNTELAQRISCTLPMRNWNERLVFPIPTFYHVVPYLWGIETWHYKIVSINHNQFLRCTLPMRNWNIHCFLSCNTSSLRCTLPMRNWNCESITLTSITFC